MIKYIICYAIAATIVASLFLVMLTLCGDTAKANNCAKFICYMIPFWIGFVTGLWYDEQ